MFKKLLIVLFALLLIPAASAQSAAQKEADYQNLINTYWMYGPSYSLNIADAFIAQYPTIADAYAYRAGIYRLMYDTDSAFAEVEAGLAIEETALLLAVRGRLYMEQGDKIKAFADIDRALSYGTSDLTMLYMVAGSYTVDNRDGEAINLLNFIIDSGDAWGAVYTMRGTLSIFASDYGAALNDFEQGVALFPQDPNTWVYRGQYYEAIGRLQLARDDYTQAIQLDNQVAAPYQRRGLLYSLANDFTGAMEDYTQAINLAPYDHENYVNRGLTFFQMGDFDDALDDLTTAIDLKPDFGRSYYNRGIVYRALGNDEAALEDYTNSIIYDPDYTPAYLNRGAIYMELENYGLAEQDFSIALQSNRDNVQLLAQRGVALSYMGNHAEAERMFSAAIEIDPYDIVLYNSRAIERFELGRYNDALEDTNYMLVLDLDFITAYEMQIAIYEILGNAEKVAETQALLDEANR